jgi:hypothetical protein
MALLRRATNVGQRIWALLSGHSPGLRQAMIAPGTNCRRGRAERQQHSESDQAAMATLTPAPVGQSTLLDFFHDAGLPVLRI